MTLFDISENSIFYVPPFQKYTIDNITLSGVKSGGNDLFYEELFYNSTQIGTKTETPRSGTVWLTVTNKEIIPLSIKPCVWTTEGESEGWTEYAFDTLEGLIFFLNRNKL